MKRILLGLTAMLWLLLSISVQAQDKTVKGRITSAEDGSGLPGVNVVLKGTTNGTVTDVNGNYTITVPSAQSVLVFSFIGLKSQEHVVGERSTVDVPMSQDLTELSEVVVTAGGLETTRKAQGYNTTVLKTDILTTAKPVNVIAGLNGKVAGLQISSTGGGVNPNFRMVLRGQRSLTGNNQALVVLDNVIVPTAILSNLNPDDIESVNVLNGAGAAALYGSEASNGALILTTKKGKKGGGMTVKVSNTVTIEQVAFYPKLQNTFGSGSAIDKQVYLEYENQQYGDAFDGSIRPIGRPLENGDQQYVKYSATDDKKKFWEKGLTNITDFAVSSGNEKSTFYLSGQYANVTGTTPGDKYKRASARFSGTTELSKQLHVSYNAQYSQNRYDVTTETANIYDNLLNTPAQIPLTSYKDWRNNEFANPNGYYNDYYRNPYFAADNWREAPRNDYFVASSELKYAPLSWLEFTGRVGLSTRNTSNHKTIGKFTFSDYTKSVSKTSAKSDVAGGVTDEFSYLTRINSDFLVSAKKDINDFSFGAVAMFSLRQDQSKATSTSVNGLVVPGLENIGNGSASPTSSDESYLARQVGLSGVIDASYKDYLFLKLTGRNDWVSTLAKANRAFFYPAVNLSFVPSEAIAALDDIQAMDFLKVRGGWSKVGQVNLPGWSTNLNAYQLQSTFSQQRGYPYSSGGGFSLDDRLVANSLKPEMTTQWEAGFDANFFGDRIESSLTYYDSHTKDQTVSTGISSASGYSSYLVNTGETASKGWEAVLHVTPIKYEDFDIRVGGNYTYLDNKVVSISSDLDRLSLASYTSGAGSYAVKGLPFPVIMGTTYKRDPEGRVIVDRTTGYPSVTTDISVLGNAQAKHRLGLDIAVRYKNFRLTALAEYRGGYKIYNSGGSTLDFSGSSIRTVMYNRERFVFPNSSYEDPEHPGEYIANTNITVRDGGAGFWTTNTYNTGVHEVYTTSGEFWKLREVSLTYTLPAALLAKTKFIKGASVSVQGRNLFVWLPPSNIYTDPEYSDAGNDSNGIGLTGLGQTPPSRFYGATVSLTF